MKGAAKWVALAVVAFVLWRLIAERDAAAAAQPAPSDGGPKPTGLVDPSTLPPPDMSRDVASDVQNGDPLALDFMADDVIFNKELPLWTDFMQPAGRVRLFADCPRDVWRIAFGWMAMTLDRQIKRSRRWQQWNSNMYDQQTGQTVDSVVGGIVATIAGIIGGPIVAALLKYAVNTQVADLGAAIAQEGAVVDFVARMRQNANPAKMPPSVLIVLQGNANALPLGDPNATATMLARASNMDDATANSIGIESPFYLGPTAWHKPDGSRFYFPASWFMLTNVGLYSPWVASELIGKDWRATVNIRARVARCIDAFAAMLAPLQPSGFKTEGRYWYRNKVYGDILGSWFPPTDEDSPYIDANGVRFNFDGSKWQNPRSQGSVGINVNIPGEVPTGAAASAGGDGGEFNNATQAPTQGNVALTPTSPTPQQVQQVGITLISTTTGETVTEEAKRAHRAL